MVRREAGDGVIVRRVETFGIDATIALHAVPDLHVAARSIFTET